MSGKTLQGQEAAARVCCSQAAPENSVLLRSGTLGNGADMRVNKQHCQRAGPGEQLEVRALFITFPNFCRGYETNSSISQCPRSGPTPSLLPQSDQY